MNEFAAGWSGISEYCDKTFTWLHTKPLYLFTHQNPGVMATKAAWEIFVREITSGYDERKHYGVEVALRRMYTAGMISMEPFTPDQVPFLSNGESIRLELHTVVKKIEPRIEEVKVCRRERFELFFTYMFACVIFVFMTWVVAMNIYSINVKMNRIDESLKRMQNTVNVFENMKAPVVDGVTTETP